MRIAILGAGALGSVMGGLLSAAGKDVELWDLNKAHLNAINKNGLRIDGPNGTQTVRVPALLPEEAKVTPELIILLTKTIHSGMALSSVRHHVDAGAHVLTLQNGIGNAERIAEFVPEDKVFYGCTMMPGRFIAPGHVASQGDGFAVFKALHSSGRAFAETLAFESDLLNLQLTEETDQIIWQKAAFNCAMNAVCGLSGARVGELSGADVLPMLKNVSAEVVNVAQAIGINADHASVVSQIEFAIAHHTEHKPSMLQDIEAGRTTEIESLCGEVSRLARKNGVAAPLNDALAVLVRLKSQINSKETEVT